MRHRLAQDRHSRYVRRPQPFQSEIETHQIATTSGVAGFLDAHFGLVAHRRLNVPKRDLFLTARVQREFFQFAPRHAAVGAQPRHGVFQGVGRDR